VYISVASVVSFTGTKAASSSVILKFLSTTRKKMVNWAVSPVLSYMATEQKTKFKHLDFMVPKTLSDKSSIRLDIESFKRLMLKMACF
jgi:hypothetical protein